MEGGIYSVKVGREVMTENTQIFRKSQGREIGFFSALLKFLKLTRLWLTILFLAQFTGEIFP